MFAAATIMLGGVLVSFQPGHVGGNWIGVVEIASACLSWGIDNNSRNAFRYVTLLRLLESRLWALARACL